MNRRLRTTVWFGAAGIALAAGVAVSNWNRRVRQRAKTQHKIDAVQPYLALNPDVGYLWRKNLAIAFAGEDSWLDTRLEGIEPVSITTDRYGFQNHPQAIAAFERGDPEIIGVGDSFMHDAAREFYGAFAHHGHFYYSMAMFRHCPPQYNRVLSSYVLRHKPEHVVYGIYENDFRETGDYRSWEKLGLDWFAFHGGTWCGDPAISTVRGVAANDEELFADVLERILEAEAICASNHMGFTLMLFPSKEYAVFGRRSSKYETEYFDRIVREAERREIRVVDIRKVFADEASPERFYWKADGHWCYRGMQVAAQALLRSYLPTITSGVEASFK